MSKQEPNKQDPTKGQNKPAVPAPGKNPDFPGSGSSDPPPIGEGGGTTTP